MSDPREELARIRARADAATDGPWRTSTEQVWADRDPAGFDAFHIAACSDAVGLTTAKDARNAEFIAAARTDVPRLAAFAEAVLDLADGGTVQPEHAWRTAVRALARDHLAGDDQ